MFGVLDNIYNILLTIITLKCCVYVSYLKVNNKLYILTDPTCANWAPVVWSPHRQVSIGGLETVETTGQETLLNVHILSVIL